MRGEPRRFFFAHVQKAAGTSLFGQLQREFPRAALYPDPSDAAPMPAPILFVSHLEARYRLRRDDIRVVTGHFPLRTTEVLGDPFTTMTVVREPVERTLSFLRHHRRRNTEDAGRSLEEIYEDPIRFHGLVENNMVKMFSLTPDEMTAGDGLMTHVRDFGPERRARAREGLESVDVLGLDTDYPAFVGELSTRFGWDLGEVMTSNRTEPVDVPASFRRRIAADNEADVELFEFATELHARRRSGGDA